MFYIINILTSGGLFEKLRGPVISTKTTFLTPEINIRLVTKICCSLQNHEF